MLDSWRTVRPSKWTIKMDHQNGLSNRFLGWAGPTLFFSRVGACPPCPPRAGAPGFLWWLWHYLITAHAVQHSFNLKYEHKLQSKWMELDTWMWPVSRDLTWNFLDLDWLDFAIIIVITDLRNIFRNSVFTEFRNSVFTVPYDLRIYGIRNFGWQFKITWAWYDGLMILNRCISGQKPAIFLLNLLGQSLTQQLNQTRFILIGFWVKQSGPMYTNNQSWIYYKRIRQTNTKITDKW